MASISFVEGAWRALIRRKGHKPISKRFPTKTAATAWARGIEAQIDAGRTPAASSMGVTIANLIDTYRELRATVRPVLDTSTEHYTLKQLAANLGDKRAAARSVDDLIGWAKARRDDGAGPYTVNCDLSKLGTVLRYAGEGLPDVIGVARPKLAHLGLIGGGGKRERRPTEDEIARIVAWLNDKKGLAFGDLVMFAIATAMRRGEICRLQWSDVDWKKKMVLVRDRKDPHKKQGNDQWVPLLGVAWPLIEGLELVREADEPRIFAWDEQTISKYFREACVALGIPDLHFHDLRHEGTSRLFEQGFEIPEVALVTGHKDWRHLRRYTNLKPESLHARGKRRDS
jgi:integrase